MVTGTQILNATRDLFGRKVWSAMFVYSSAILVLSCTPTPRTSVGFVRKPSNLLNLCPRVRIPLPGPGRTNRCAQVSFVFPCFVCFREAPSERRMFSAFVDLFSALIRSSGCYWEWKLCNLGVGDVVMFVWVEITKGYGIIGALRHGGDTRALRRIGLSYSCSWWRRATGSWSD